MPDGLLPISFPPELLKSTDGELSSSEEWWRDHQEWLAQKGYMLRSRYRPGWKPSWQTSPKLAGRRFNVEDGTLQIVSVDLCHSGVLHDIHILVAPFHPYL